MTARFANISDAPVEMERVGALIVFEAAQQAYALPLTDVREVLPMAELSRPPGLPSILDGFLNLAGQAVPVVRLAELFHPDMPRPEGASLPNLYAPLLIVAVRERLMALAADKVIETITPRQFDLVPLEKGHSFNGCARGIVRKGESTILLLSPERILLDEETKCLEQNRSAEQRRLEAIQNSAVGDQLTRNR